MRAATTFTSVHAGLNKNGGLRAVPFFFLFISLSFLSFAKEPIVLSGSITGVPQYVKTILYLDRYEGMDFVTADSVVITKDGTYRLQDVQGVPGLYRLSLARENSIELVLSANDRGINFTATYEQLSNAMAYIHHSKENTAYQEYLQLVYAADSQRQDFRQVATMISGFDPKARTRSLQLEQQEEIFNTTFNEKLDKLALAYPGSFTAEVLCRAAKYPVMKNNPLAEGYDNYPAFLHHHFWSAIPFEDERLARHPMLNEKVIDYLFAYCETSEKGLMEGAQIILDKPGHVNVQDMLYSQLLSLFYRKKLFGVIEQVAVKYHVGKTKVTIDAALAERLTTILALQPGKPIPDLTLPDQSKHPISVRSVAAANNLTLLIFWTSGCEGCEKEFALLTEYAAAFRNKKLTVYAASMERDAAVWKEALQSVPEEYIHVTADAPLDEMKVTKDFNIQHTPSTFLIDSKGLIVAKDLHGAQLKEAIEKYLASR